MGTRRPSLVLALILSLLPLTGCAALADRRQARAADLVSAVRPVSGSSSVGITVDGRRRTYRLYVPPKLNSPKPAPLVVMLHGGFGDAEQAEKAYGWDEAASDGQFVVAYPDGAGRAWDVGAGCCGKPGKDGVDDVAFVTAVISDIGRRIPIDRSRTYATGISNGGMMAYRLACDTTLFAAVAPVAATLLGSCSDHRRTSLLHIHGLADTRVRMDGQPGTGTVRIDGPPVPSVLARWRHIDRCRAPVVKREAPLTTTTAGCPGGRRVTLLTVDGAGHQWPGSTITPAQKALGADPPSTALDATATIWTFFAAHPR